MNFGNSTRGQGDRGPIASFWQAYATAEWIWARRKPDMDEVAWIEAAGEALYPWSNLGIAPLGEGSLATRNPRRLYKYRRYEHPQRGVIYRLYTDSAQVNSSGPDRQYIVRSSDGELRLACEFETCLDCGATGKQGSRRCGTCGGTGAIGRSASAKRWTTLGTPGEEVHLQAPDTLRAVFDGPNADW